MFVQVCGSGMLFFLSFVLFYTFVAYVEGPQNKKKTRNLLKAEAKKAVQQNTGL